MKDFKLISQLDKDWRLGEIKIRKAGGQTNRNYIVQHKNKKFFVRLPWERKDIVNRKVEGRNIFALSRNKKLRKILPKYYLYVLNGRNILSSRKEKYELPDGTMMTEYVPGRLFKMSDFRNKKYQEKIARMFYVFHSSGVRFVNEYDVFRDELKKYRMIAGKRSLPAFITKKMVVNLERIEKEANLIAKPLKGAIPAHNDFIFQNFIVGENGKIYLLDFEYAGMNKRGGLLYDFAFLFADNFFRRPVMTKELFEQFLGISDKIYGKRLDREQIYWLALAVPAMQVWWGLLRYFDIKTKKEKRYFKKYVLDRAKGLELLYNIVNK